MHFLRRNLIFPCSPSAAVSLKSPRTEALLKGPNLAQEAASCRLSAGLYLGSLGGRAHTGHMGRRRQRPVVSKSAACKQNSLFRRNQAEHQVQALALRTAHSSHQPDAGHLVPQRVCGLTGMEALPSSSLQANKKVKPYIQGSNTQQRETTAEETKVYFLRDP